MTKPKQTGEGRQILAEKLADLTFELLERCEEKRQHVASHLGLTVAEFKVLRTIGVDEVLSVGEIAHRLQLSSSRLTRIIDGLVEKGIIRREAAIADRRVMQLALTRTGKAIQARLSNQYVKTHLEIVTLLPEGTPDAVIFAMEHLRDAMKKWSS